MHACKHFEHRFSLSLSFSSSGFPITTEAVRYGMRVAVLVIPANPLLKTPQAMRVVGPAAFGFGDIQYAPPQTIKDIRHLVA